jgi:hypothetical protein
MCKPWKSCRIKGTGQWKRRQIRRADLREIDGRREIQ